MFSHQNFRPSDLASLLVSNPYLQDAINQFKFSTLQQQPQRYPAFQNFNQFNFCASQQQPQRYPAFQNVPTTPVFHQNHLTQPRPKMNDYNGRDLNYEHFNQHLPINSPNNYISDDFLQQSFFRDSSQSPQNRIEELQVSEILKQNDNETCEGLEFGQTSNVFQDSGLLQDSGYQPSLHDSIDQYELMSGFNYSNSELALKYTRPFCLTETEYEEIRREFEMNGRNVIDQDDHTCQYSKPSNLEKYIEVPALHLPSESEVLSQSWKISEEFQLKKNNSSNNSLYNGWGTKIEKNPFEDHCVFCKNNEESAEVYMSHTLKDFDGRTTCPRLRLYTCPICGANGDNAHTLQYCPRKNAVTLEEQQAKALSQQNFIKAGRWSLSKE